MRCIPSRDNDCGRRVVGAFMTELVNRSEDIHSILKVGTSEHDCFRHVSLGREIASVSSVAAIPESSVFDLVFGDYPIGLRSRQFSPSSSNKTYSFLDNWISIYESVRYLDKTGIGIFVLEPNYFWSDKARVFQSVLEESGIFVEAIFRMPDGVFAPSTNIRPLLVAVSRTQRERIFVGDLSSERDPGDIVDNYINKVDSSEMSGGVFVDLGRFAGFDQYYVAIQIERLESQFKSYEMRKIGSIAQEVNTVRKQDQFCEADNAIYVPRIGRSGVVRSIGDLRIKPHNYYQVILQPDVRSEYLASFFASALGCLILDSLQSNAFIPQINKSSLVEAEVAIPTIEEQDAIVVTRRKILELKSELDKLESELSLNPTNSTSRLDRLDSMLQAVGSLSEEDQIRALIRTGESKIIEYKETYCIDTRKESREVYIELMVLKTIVAFMNSDGGCLLVGVSDAGKILGLSRDLHVFQNNSDKFLLHVKNRVKDRIGEQFYPYINIQLVQIDSQHILKVECKPSVEPCFLDGKEFYVRTNPATDKLEGKKQYDYIKYHFSS